MNMDGDLTSRNMNNGKRSNKENPRFRNLKVNNKDNLSNHSNKGNQRFSNLRDSSNPNNSTLNLGASNTRENHNTHSLKENLKEGMQDIKSRMTKSLEKLPSIISVG